MNELNGAVIQGYVYVPDNRDHTTDKLFTNAKAGDIITKISTESDPGSLVVDHHLYTVLIVRWPGKLYKAEVLNAEAEKELNEGLRKGVPYTRTLGVKILEELPVALLFGENGPAIAQLIDQITVITEAQVDALSAFDITSSRALYTKAWKAWIALTDANYRESPNYDCVIAVHPKNQVRKSPVDEGLSVISDTFRRKAESLVGEAAFEIDDEGDRCMHPKWLAAMEHLLMAGMSYEADNLLTEAEKATMRAPVKQVLG
jgi:hypothetical protein